jgi:hypothetical protein
MGPVAVTFLGLAWLLQPCLLVCGLFISLMEVWLLPLSQGRISPQSSQLVAATHVLFSNAFFTLGSMWGGVYIRKEEQVSGEGRKETWHLGSSVLDIPSTCFIWKASKKK